MFNRTSSDPIGQKKKKEKIMWSKEEIQGVVVSNMSAQY